MIDKNFFDKLKSEIAQGFYDLPTSDEEEDSIDNRAKMVLENILAEIKNSNYKLVSNVE